MSLEKRVMKKGCYSQEYVGVPLPKISMVWRQTVVHKQVEVEMADGSAPPHKFTDLYCEFMMLTGRALEGDKVVFLFDAVIPIMSGI
jgi:hypothetical protein